jgi:hypothetical protein
MRHRLACVEGGLRASLRHQAEGRAVKSAVRDGWCEPEDTDVRTDRSTFDTKREPAL